MPGLGDVRSGPPAPEALRLDIPAAEEGRRLRWIGPEGDEVLAQILGPGPADVFCVSKPQVVVGRESSHSVADICVAENSYVSRGHIVLRLDRESRRWLLSCNGKNGVFLNAELVRRGAAPAPVAGRSVLRFPSTSVQLEFLPLAGAPAEPSPSAPATPKASNGGGASAPSEALMDTDDGGEAEGSGTDGGAEGGGKPAFSYAQLIVQAISSNPERQLTLSGIYAFITKNYPYYRTCDKGWQNSIRHNLSLNRYFIKIPRNQEEPGKGKIGSFWRLDPISEMKLLGFAWKKRRPRGANGTGSSSRGSGSLSSEATGSATATPNLLSPQGASLPLAALSPGADKLFRSAPVSPHLNGEPGGALEIAEPSPPGRSSLPPTQLLLPTTPSGSNGLRDASLDQPSPVVKPTVLRRAESGSLVRKRPAGVSPVEQLAAAALADRSFLSLSAPSSPKAFGGGFYPNGFPRSGHPSGGSSGGTFCVTRNINDGRQRLQLCHSPPEFVAVTRAETSALQAMAEESRSRHSLLSRYRGGSKSLSTTPIRELLASGGPVQLSALAPSVAKALEAVSQGPPKKRKPSPALGDTSGIGSGGVFRPVPASPAVSSAALAAAALQLLNAQAHPLAHLGHPLGLAAAAALGLPPPPKIARTE